MNFTAFCPKPKSGNLFSENLVGDEFLEDRAEVARRRLPEGIKILVGDAAEVNLEEGPFDIVYQSTVFTSILDDGFQQKLADRMWKLVKPGGGVLWYDFIYNNPNNPDVRGVPLKAHSGKLIIGTGPAEPGTRISR